MRPMPSLKIDTATLMDAASYLVSTASERHSLPVLSMFMISIKGNSARFISSSTEREVTFTCEVDPNDCQDGTLVVPGKKLHDLVKNAPKESVATLKEDKDNAYSLRFSGLNSRYTLRGVAPEGFPTYPLDQDKIKVITVDAVQLDEGLSSVINAAAERDVRYYLNGIAFRYSKDTLNLTATDGHRLSQFMLNVEGGDENPTEPFTRILPRKAIRPLKDLLKGAKGMVKFVLTDRHFAIKVGERSLKTNLVDGQFPDVNRVIPALSTAPYLVDRKDLISVANRLSILANEKFRGAEIIVKEGEAVMSMTSANPENEEAMEQVPLKEPAKEGLVLGINIDYLRVALDSIKEDVVVIHFVDSSAAIRVNGKGSPSHLHVIMPMRI